MPDMIKFGGGRGRLAHAARLWADSVRERPDLPGSVLVMIELARDAASLADAARSEGDGRLYLSAANRLQVLMAQVERLADHDRGDAEGDDWSAELARLLGSGPAMGHAADG